MIINVSMLIIDSMYTTSEIDLPDDARAMLATYEAAARTSQSLFGRIIGLLPRPGRAFIAARAHAARAVIDRGRCIEVRVRHDQPPLCMSHEHGIILLIAIDDSRSLLLDVSSVSDDPRWDLRQAGKLMCSDWRWLRFGDNLGSSCFVADGPAVEALDLGELHDTKLEERLLADDGWPGDDAVVDLSRQVAIELAKQAA